MMSKILFTSQGLEKIFDKRNVVLILISEERYTE